MAGLHRDVGEQDRSMRHTNGTLDAQLVLEPMQALFDTGVTWGYEWRRTQLETLGRLWSENQDAICEALKSDLGKCEAEALITEVSFLNITLKGHLAKLKDFMQPQKVSSPGIAAPVYCYVRKEPRGVVLVIGPFNYPLSLSLGPALGALAAGNCVIIKPSELTPATSAVLASLASKYFDPTVLRVVQGGVSESTALLKEPYGLIFFTGSERVGKIVGKAAAETLTPTVLELGGKAPVIVDKHMPELKPLADRIAWGKTINSGQTCVAPDYMLCHKSRRDQVTSAIAASLEACSGRRLRRCKLPCCGASVDWRRSV